MKAVVCTKYGPPEVLKLKEVKKPVPKNNEILIKIFATAVTASDCIVRGFKIPYRYYFPKGLMMKLMMGFILGFTKPRKPILGMVLVGEVEAAGRDTKRFTIGEHVYGWTIKSSVQIQFGTYAEYISLSEDCIIASKPSNISNEEAAAIPYGGLLALHYLKKGNIQSGQKVLIYGASGAIGTSAVQLARYFKAKVTGVCSTSNLELVKSLGADTVIDYTKENLMDRREFYDFIFDAVGKNKNSKFKLQCKKALIPNGKYISVDDGSPKTHIEDLILLKELVESGKLKPVVDRRYPIELIVEAHRYVDKGHKKGNVVVTI